MVGGLKWMARVGAVLLGAAALLVAGRALLAANAQVRPMWQGPNAVPLAQAQLVKAQAAVATAKQDIAQLQLQTQQISANANSLAQLLAQVGIQATGQGGTSTLGRTRRFGGDDGGGF